MYIDDCWKSIKVDHSYVEELDISIKETQQFFLGMINVGGVHLD